MLIIYCHGLASRGHSPRSEMLINRFGEQNVVAPDLPVAPIEVIDMIESIIHSRAFSQLLFVGTSLGGFWANYFAQKYKVPCVLINPVIYPNKTMERRIGVNIRQFAETTNSSAVLTDVLHQFSDLEAWVSTNIDPTLVNLFLATDDKILDCNDTLVDLSTPNSCVIKNSGGHRFEDNFDEVVAKVGELLNA